MRNAMVRKPTHPGIFLKEDYMVPLGLSQAKIAKLLHVNKRTGKNGGTWTPITEILGQ